MAELGGPRAVMFCDMTFITRNVETAPGDIIAERVLGLSKD